MAYSDNVFKQLDHLYEDYMDDIDTVIDKCKEIIADFNKYNKDLKLTIDENEMKEQTLDDIVEYKDGKVVYSFRVDAEGEFPMVKVEDVIGTEGTDYYDARHHVVYDVSEDDVYEAIREDIGIDYFFEQAIRQLASSGKYEIVEVGDVDDDSHNIYSIEESEETGVEHEEEWTSPESYRSIPHPVCTCEVMAIGKANFGFVVREK